MKGNTTRKLITLAGVILLGALLSITVLYCGEGDRITGSAYTSIITRTLEGSPEPVSGGAGGDWGCEASNDPDAQFLWCLGPAYPNPAQGRTTISFSIAVACHVKIAIYNVYKGHVETLVDRDFEQPGSRQTEWDASGYNSGLYWCYMWAGDFESKGRILIIQ